MDREKARELDPEEAAAYQAARLSPDAWDAYCGTLTPGPHMDAVLALATDTRGVGIAVKAVLGCCTGFEISTDWPEDSVHVSLSDDLDGGYSGECTHELPDRTAACPWADEYGLHDGTCVAYAIGRVLLHMYSPSDSEDLA